MHRTDIGDLEPLKASIERLGLLQPITIAPDGTLICGRRRLEAIRELGWTTVKVWVRTGLSDRLHSLLAWQDENTLHKPLTELEAARLFRELNAAMKEDSQRRQEATQFKGSMDTEDRTDATSEGETESGRGDGGVESTPPSSLAGKTRSQAARAVTGVDSHQRLERINDLADLASDTAVALKIREVAQAGLDEIDAGKPVAPIYEHVMALKREEDEAELDRLAREALERVKQPRSRRKVSKEVAQRKRSVRGFVHTWTDMNGWSARYDAEEIGVLLDDEQWALFERVVDETAAFHRAAADARSARVTSTVAAS
ncbi:ParB N-terminal domain-containing protein [Nocardioides sambongensis]|uniref:ParB N-terminal domain-containing protein n=1 Tax=Nocardioides sambongensis TaxID=2589074 RepID=UPI001E49321D|nr:ParB N-terminal domain-containing protein [Nocardioides sambongensis]